MMYFNYNIQDDISTEEEEYGQEKVGLDLLIRTSQRDEGKLVKVIKYNQRRKEHLVLFFNYNQVEYEDGSQSSIHLSNYLVDVLRND